MSKENGARSVKGTNFWLTLKDNLQECIKNQCFAFKCNIANNFVMTITYFMVIFMVASIVEKIILEDENWLNKTVIFAVLAAIPWFFKGTIIVKIVSLLEEMFLLIELSVIFILGVLLNYSIDNNITTLIYFNLYLSNSLFHNSLVASIKEK